MIIGVDFDNTIVCYDGIFHKVAFERGLVPAELPTDKTSVRDYLRQTGREQAWTEIQGDVYGPRLKDASPYPGVLDFFRFAVSRGIAVRIVSHKTRRPFLGEPHDLHAAAWSWLEQHGFFSSEAIGMKRDRVFLEETLDAKFQRIRTEGCTHFIDDLPEFLRDVRFPETAQPLLFAPVTPVVELGSLSRLHHWGEAQEVLFPQVPTIAALSMARAVLKSGTPECRDVTGGANNRVFHFRDLANEAIIKAYHHNATDPRDRFSAERSFYRLLTSAGVPSTPTPLAWDEEYRLCALSVIQGRKLAAQEIGLPQVTQAIEWISDLQKCRNHPLASTLPLAADACLSLQDHLALAERRAARLRDAAAHSGHPEFVGFVTEELLPQISLLTSGIRAQAGPHIAGSLESSKRILSPSDFGFHNALQDASGRMWFLDFEYAGWDDPVKLLCDFFCQPQAPVALDHAAAFLNALEAALGDDTLRERFELLLPLHAAKWSCILLNEFLPVEAHRRRFAGVRGSDAELRSTQLEKARRMLARSRSLS